MRREWIGWGDPWPADEGARSIRRLSTAQADPSCPCRRLYGLSPSLRPPSLLTGGNAHVQGTVATDRAALLRAAIHIARPLGLDPESSPLVDARLDDGSRVLSAFPPRVLKSLSLFAVSESVLFQRMNLSSKAPSPKP